MASDFVHLFIPSEKGNKNTLILLHGTGGDENDLVPLGTRVAPDFNLLSLRGKVLENGMPRFFKRLGMGIFDIEDLKFRADELAAFLKDAVEKYGLDASKLIVLGYSNGANIASGVILRHPSVLAAAILLRPMVPYRNAEKVDLKAARILIIAGENDPTMNPKEPKELATLFSGMGAETNIIYEPTGHNLSSRDVTLAKDWISKNFV